MAAKYLRMICTWGHSFCCCVNNNIYTPSLSLLLNDRKNAMSYHTKKLITTIIVSYTHYNDDCTMMATISFYTAVPASSSSALPDAVSTPLSSAFPSGHVLSSLSTNMSVSEATKPYGRKFSSEECVIPYKR